MSATYFAVWHGTRDMMAALVYTTENLAQAQRIVAAMERAGQAGYITREQGCLMHRETGEVVE